MLNQYSRLTRCRLASRQGFTLIETMISMITGSVILGSVLFTCCVSNSSMIAIGNYNNLNQASRNTLDIMSRDLRNTAVVTSLSSNQVTVSNTITGDTINYSWDGTNAFTRTINGVRTVMLTGCDALFFNGYQRNPTNDLQFLPASTVSQVKLINVSWRCSRKVLGAKLNTDSVQTAQICIRN
jgi:hypothetical protein